MRTWKSSVAWRAVALVSLLALCAAGDAHAAIFMRIDRSGGGIIEGESLDRDHPAWIELASCQFGLRNSTNFLSGGGLSTGKAESLQVAAVKSLDRASPLLFLACAQGAMYPRVVLEFTDDNNVTGGSRVFCRLTLTNVLVNNLATSSSEGRPQEAVGLTYERIQFDYFMVDSKGSYPSTPTSTTTWNFVTNTK